MRFLLDTHTFLWFVLGDARLGGSVRRLIEAPDNLCQLSTASLWEMAIKTSLGKLEILLPISRLVDEQVLGNGIDVLAIAPRHLDTLASLPFHHRDPFDRLLIAQSISENLPILGHDDTFDAYPIERVWPPGH
ncbi:MAG: type II toxin-antitoxin system VapC family toxin [Thermoanaerobaculia bacterium]|nr:type II toxin-antitoxin system VapC family toxin [Thermoanaerobaculia bacterium]